MTNMCISLNVFLGNIASLNLKVISQFFSLLLKVRQLQKERQLQDNYQPFFQLTFTTTNTPVIGIIMAISDKTNDGNT